MDLESIINQIDSMLINLKDKEKFQYANELTKHIRSMLPISHNPVASVQWIPVENVQANDYNPNGVPERELYLLSVSINSDGYTQPCVVIWDENINKYVIVDGFHRYFCMKTNEEINQKNQGMLPVVVLEKDINDRMASTVRHNRARGKHSVAGMGTLVAKMQENGWEEEKICHELGLGVDELIRFTHTSGVASLFKDKKFNKSWEEEYQIKNMAKAESQE